MAVDTIIITLVVLSAGCVLSHNTTDVNDTSLELAQLQQQKLQMGKVLDHLLENLNELQTLVTSNCGT